MSDYIIVNEDGKKGKEYHPISRIDDAMGIRRTVLKLPGKDKLLVYKLEEVLTEKINMTEEQFNIRRIHELEEEVRVLKSQLSGK